MAAPSARLVHPCYLSVFEGNSGVEYSTWARITDASCRDEPDEDPSPADLVTAHASTLSIYRVEESTGKMLLVQSFSNLAGNVCYLETLNVNEYEQQAECSTRNYFKKKKRPDSLLIGFSGHPRLAIVQVKSNLLLATTMLDLSPALTDLSYGAATPLEQDMTACLHQRKRNHQATVSVVVGGGVAVVCVQLKYYQRLGGWTATDEPYLLPFASLAKSIYNAGSSGSARDLSGSTGGLSSYNTDAANHMYQSTVTGFGDILSTAFLTQFSEPTVVLLHSNPFVGRMCSGRLGRDEGGTRYSLILTAVTVTVGHQRSALLWSTEVPADAIFVYSALDDGNLSHRGTKSTDGMACLVHCVNSVVFVSNSGQIRQCLAVNGWVGTTLSATYSNMVEANPWPFPKLSIQLDGAQFTPVNATTWFVLLRRGEVYLLQSTGGKGQWALMSLYQTIGGLGEVSQARCLALGKVATDSAIGAFYLNKESLMDVNSKTRASSKDLSVDIGLVVVASRLGDTSLLGYAIEETTTARELEKEFGTANVKRESTLVQTKEESVDLKRQDDLEDSLGGTTTNIDEAYDRFLRTEEEALYAPVSADGNSHNHGPHVVPPSDDDEDANTTVGIYSNKRKRARFSRINVVRALTVLDSMTSTGPLGPGCAGPLAASPEIEVDPFAAAANTSQVFGTMGYIFPCGFGSSGGLALMSVPGRDNRAILAEADCVNAMALFGLSDSNLVLVSVSPEHGGTMVMKLEDGSSAESGNTKENTELDVVEVEISRWCPDENSREFFTSCNLLAAVDLRKDLFLMVVASPINESLHSYFAVVFEVQTDGTIKMTSANQIDVPQGEFVTSASVRHDHQANRVLLGVTITTGQSNILSIATDGSVLFTHSFVVNSPMDTANEQVEEGAFYANDRVTAVDIFSAPRSFFSPNHSRVEASENIEKLDEALDVAFDEDEKDLYNAVEISVQKQRPKKSPHAKVTSESSESIWYAAICRQSGKLELFAVSDLSKPIWNCFGCGHGVVALSPRNQNISKPRNPVAHKVYVREMRFAFCGPSFCDSELKSTPSRPFCLILETNEGDTHVYAACAGSTSLRVAAFERVPLKDVSRPSQESAKHLSKLRRKRIVSANHGIENTSDFRHNRLFAFQNVQKQQGAFAATSRPFWLLADRGKPTILYHRCRHVAPSGTRSRPVAGFCHGLRIPDCGFMTLHERVGRVGSQRMTVFGGLVNLNSKHSILPGGGLFVEKVPFGVTVRRIQFIDDEHSSTGTRPLYAILVSRDYEADQSSLNDDGLTEEQRQQMAEEKESAKIQRQVEADLGGFDVEHEWVEDIEREDCFQIDKRLGGAPPIPRSAYALWIVDASNGWQVVDSYELEEDEIGLTLKVMPLSNFRAEPGNNDNISDEDLEWKYFVTVGTGIVKKDGEDVASKGRVILFEVRRSKDSSSLQAAELSFVYDKRIHHGPVNSLSCLTSEGKHRLIIGAGADVNIEQWGNDKLTQVGFFRATMYILDISLFKNFFILSDAYDSLHFLVWRESDKSLTLLAKDYDPIPVYAAGVLSRGGSLDFICHDDRQNLQFFQYSPGDPAARGGNKLVCRADFHLGSQTTDIACHYCRSSLLINSATPSSTLAALKQQDTFHGKADDDQRLAASFGTSDGGYSSVVPLSEPVFWRLTALQSVLVNALESDCGLSHRAWRLYRRTPRRGGCRNNARKKGVIDGDLVMKYADLSKIEQEDLASAIGSTVEMILDNLLELRCSAMVL